MTGMDVTEVLLPGVGLRYEFTTQEGNRMGVVARRSGDVEVCCVPGAGPGRESAGDQAQP
jgi:TrkA domain protein